MKSKNTEFESNSPLILAQKSKQRKLKSLVLVVEVVTQLKSMFQAGNMGGFL